MAIIEFATETLTGIPSIIFGLVGMLFFLQLMGLKTGILAGGLTLVIMILPTIVRTTQESLKTVPQSYREGALAWAPGKWHMVRTVVLPNAVDGIVTGCILAVGRIVGESAALLFTAGFGLVLNNFLTSLQASSAHPDRGPVCLRQRAGRDRRGLCHRRRSDDPGAPVINLSATLAGRRLRRKAVNRRRKAAQAAMDRQNYSAATWTCGTAEPQALHDRAHH